VLSKIRNIFLLIQISLFFINTIRIFEKLIKFLSDISCELSSINVKSDKYKPKYGTHGGSTLFKINKK